MPDFGVGLRFENLTILSHYFEARIRWVGDVLEQQRTRLDKCDIPIDVAVGLGLRRIARQPDDFARSEHCAKFRFRLRLRHAGISVWIEDAGLRRNDGALAVGTKPTALRH